MLANASISVDILSLPTAAWTRAKFSFDPNDEMWVIPDSSRERYFNFESVNRYCSQELVLSLKKTLIWYLRERSLPHANNMFNLFVNMLNTIIGQEIITSITDHHIISYKGNLPEENQYFLGSLSGFIKRWHEMGYPGISPQAYAILKELRIKGNSKGWAVLTFDPEEGPFDEIEINLIHRAVNNAYAEQKIDSRQFVLSWLFMEFGVRPVQMAALKVKDFLVVTTDKGKEEYFINMPRAKQRYTIMRRLFKLRQLDPRLAVAIEALIALTKFEHTNRIADDIPAEDLPIFPSWWSNCNPGFEHHSTGNQLSNELDALFSKLNIKSHRTGQKMHITPRRFRYTLGTRTAMEHHGALVIAEMLDHNDTQNVMVYTKCTPEIIKILDKALAKELAPYANAFAGKIVIDDGDAKHSNDPTTMIRHPKLNPNTGGIGRCGSDCRDCGAMLPVACYVCHNFQAWLDAPHEQVLNELIEERQRILSETGDERIAFINDHVILAVQQVVTKCYEMKGVTCG